jgi:hypothetical protein
MIQILYAHMNKIKIFKKRAADINLRGVIAPGTKRVN